MIIFCVSMHLINAQSRDSTAFHSCEATVICAIPQLLTGTNISSSEMTSIIMQARNDNIILTNGKVANREMLAERVLLSLRRTEIVVTFGSDQLIRGALIGYIIEISSNNESHFVLAGTDRRPIFNPCNVNGSIVSTQEVYVNAR